MSRTARTPRRLAFRLGLAAASLLAALLVAELGVRAWARLAGEPYSPWTTRLVLAETVGRMTGVDPVHWTPNEAPSGFTLHPYAGFDSLRVAQLTEEEAARPAARSPGDWAVYVFGGSVAAGFVGGGGGDDLRQRLGDLPWLADRQPRVLGFAVPAFKQPQQLELLAYLLARGCRPDCVINLDGLNEIRIAETNARNGFPPSWPGGGYWGRRSLVTPMDAQSLDLLLEMRECERRAHRIAAAAIERGYLFSALLGRITLSRLLRVRADWTRLSRRYDARLLESGEPDGESRPAPPEAGETLVEEAVRYWFESSLLMHQLCRARGIRYLHALQPTLHDRGSKPVTEEERRLGIGAAGYDESVVAGYALMRAGLEELARRGVEVLDLSRAFAEVEETLYVDSCHFGPPGKRILSERIAQYLARSGSPIPGGER